MSEPINDEAKRAWIKSVDDLTAECFRHKARIAELEVRISGLSGQALASDGGPAFPMRVALTDESIPFSSDMSIRAWLAGQALGHIPALLERLELNKCYAQIAEHACRIADAVIAELSKKAEPNKMTHE